MIKLYTLITLSLFVTYAIWVAWLRWSEFKAEKDWLRAEYTFKLLRGGNVGFSYRPCQMSDQELSVLIGLPLMIMGLCAVIAGQMEGRWRMILLIVPCFYFVYIYKRMNVGAKNRKREKVGVSSYFSCDKITEICSGFFPDHPVCLFSNYIIHQTEELGVFERFVAAHLSDGTTIVFKVVRRKDERGKWSFTIIMNPEVVGDKEITNRVLPFWERIKRTFNPDYNDFMALIAYLLMWMILAVLTVGPFFLNYRLWGTILFGYSIIGWILALIRKPQEYPQWFIKAYTFPGRLMNLLVVLTAPLLVFLVGLFVIMVVAVILAAFIYGLSWIFTNGRIGLNINYVAFLCVMSFSLTAVYANGVIQRIFECLDVFRNFTDKTMDSPMLGMIEYVYQKENINCVLYTTYLIFISLSTFGLYLSDSHEYLISEDIDSAIIKAFLIHIAFTNMVTRRKEIKINIKGIMEYVIKIFKQK